MIPCQFQVKGTCSAGQQCEYCHTPSKIAEARQRLGITVAPADVSSKTQSKAEAAGQAAQSKASSKGSAADRSSKSAARRARQAANKAAGKAAAGVATIAGLVNPATTSEVPAEHPARGPDLPDASEAPAERLARGPRGKTTTLPTFLGAVTRRAARCLPALTAAFSPCTCTNTLHGPAMASTPKPFARTTVAS